MDDRELDNIRQKRMAELQQQQQKGLSGAGTQQQQQQQQQNQEEMARQQREMKNNILSQVLSQEARARCGSNFYMSEQHQF